MSKFVVLGSWTAQGAADYGSTLKRVQASSELWVAAGGRLIDIYWTLGQYDFVAIVEAPDDATATSVLLRLGAMGSFRTATMRAFDRAEWAEVLAAAAG
jgi:uncharacterized protein with GYD domain